MVHTMVSTGQNQMDPLQKLDPTRQAKISVRPFVNLIRHRNVNSQKQPIPMPNVILCQFFGRQTALLIKDDRHFVDDQHEIIPVHFDEIVSRDRRRIDTVEIENLSIEA